MMVETKYPIEDSFLDVIWKRTIRSVQTFGFSVNLQGAFERPLHTLKCAYDVWNTRPFLITEEGRVDNAQELTTGLYHEFAPALKILSVPQVQELYKSKKNYFALEERYGLR